MGPDKEKLLVGVITYLKTLKSDEHALEIYKAENTSKARIKG
jgi:hypothetical protein